MNVSPRRSVFFSGEAVCQQKKFSSARYRGILQWQPWGLKRQEQKRTLSSRKEGEAMRRILIGVVIGLCLALYIVVRALS